MANFYSAVSILFCVLLQAYCGFFRDAYVLISVGAITSFPNNRNDPRFIIKDSRANTSLVCAINSNTIWLLKNITGTGYTKIQERSSQMSSSMERSMLTSTSSLTLYNQNFTLIVKQIPLSTINGQTIELGEGLNQLFGVASSATKTTFYMRNINNYTIKWSYEVLGYQNCVYDLQNSSVIAVLFPSPANGTILLEVRKIVNFSSVSILNSQIIICANTRNVQIKASEYYYAVYNGTQIQVYNYCQNCLPIWTINVTFLTNFQFCGSWFLYSSKGIIYQHDISNGTFLSTLQTNYTNPSIKILQFNNQCMACIYQINVNTILTQYLDNNPGTVIQSTIFSSTLDFANSTSYIISNYSPPVNNTVIFGSTSSTLIFGGGTGFTNSTFIFGNSTPNTTVIFGTTNTSFAIASPNSSYSISNYTTPSGKFEWKNILTIISIINSLRVKDLFEVYFIITQLGYHNYHNVNYTGTVRKILDLMSYIQSHIWTLISSDEIINKIENVYELSGYQNYTNIKFYEVEGTDSLFFQNMKDYLFMSAPLSFISFFTFHLLYKALKCCRLGIKSLFRSYSLPYAIILVLFVQNISRLSFLACHNFTHLFSFNTTLYLVQALTVIFVGFITILAVSFCYHIQYLYGKKIGSISFNLRRIQWWATINLIRLVIRPVIEIAFNVFFFEHYNIVILSLCMTQTLTFVILSGFQIFNNCFKKKIQFFNECLQNLVLFLFNFILFLKYYAYSELELIFESWIQKLVYILISISVVEIIILIVQIIAWIKKKLKIKKQLKDIVKLRTKGMKQNRLKRKLREQQIRRTQFLRQGQDAQPKSRLIIKVIRGKF